jgi:4'-phosphopantetheinyl transferase
LALYGFTRGREIGLDLEFRREDFASEQIAEHFFSAREVEMLRALPLQLKTEGFFNCWTRKEAYIKAVGLGLSLPLDQFDVSLAPQEPVALLRTGDDEREAARWSLKALTPAEGYSAALAVEGHDWHLKCWGWTG